jgi:short-subunit dehydrogenase
MFVCITKQAWSQYEYSNSSFSPICLAKPPSPQSEPTEPLLITTASFPVSSTASLPIMSSILIIGATRGLGAQLVKRYASNSSNTVYGTSRSSTPPASPAGPNIHWIPSIDLTNPDCGKSLSNALSTKIINTTIITAGFFGTESFETPSWKDQLTMYTTSAIAPSFLVSSLINSSIIPAKSHAKIILVSSESGSITLRHPQEGGGNFGHHGSKAATNMLGKLLSLDLAPKDIAVGIVHPSFMRTEMTKGVGFDKFWDDGGALRPEEAAEILGKWVDGTFGMELTGQYWAPRGTRDIGTWDAVMGRGTGREGPVQLPW